MKTGIGTKNAKAKEVALDVCEMKSKRSAECGAKRNPQRTRQLVNGIDGADGSMGVMHRCAYVGTEVGPSNR